jgi:hypothetical protein
MKTSFDSIAIIVIGLFGIIAGILNTKMQLGLWNYSKLSNQNTRRFISILVGSIFLFIGLALLRELNVR